MVFQVVISGRRLGRGTAKDSTSAHTVLRTSAREFQSCEWVHKLMSY